MKWKNILGTELKLYWYEQLIGYIVKIFMHYSIQFSIRNYLIYINYSTRNDIIFIQVIKSDGSSRSMEL